MHKSFSSEYIRYPWIGTSSILFKKFSKFTKSRINNENSGEILDGLNFEPLAYRKKHVTEEKAKKNKSSQKNNSIPRQLEDTYPHESSYRAEMHYLIAIQANIPVIYCKEVDTLRRLCIDIDHFPVSTLLEVLGNNLNLMSPIWNIEVQAANPS